MNKLWQKVIAFYGDNSSRMHWLFNFAITIIAADILSSRQDDHIGKVIWFIFMVAFWTYMSKGLWENAWTHIKAPLAKLLAKDIALTFPTFDRSGETPINLSIDSVNNVWVRPITQAWQFIYDNWPNTQLTDCVGDDSKMGNTLHRQYVSPIHNWCVDNLQGNFFLWSDSKGVHLLLIETGDRVLWKLTWGNTLPTPKEVFDFAHIT